MNKYNFTTNIAVNNVLNQMIGGLYMVGKLIVYLAGMALIMLIIYCLIKSGIIPTIDLSGIKGIRYVSKPALTDWM